MPTTEMTLVILQNGELRYTDSWAVTSKSSTIHEYSAELASAEAMKQLGIRLIHNAQMMEIKAHRTNKR